MNMPILDIKKDKLSELLGKKLNDKQLWELLFQFGMELDSVSDDEYKIEITPDRPDLLSSYGLARAIRYYLDIENPKQYKVDEKSDWVIKVDQSLRGIRPYIGGFLVKGLKITEEQLKEMIYVQEKLHDTLCRGREAAAIGIYPSNKIKPPIIFTAYIPKMIKFIPLGALKEMTGDDILTKHPTGREYAHLLKNKERYPVLVDSKNDVLSMPPIINSETSGRITVDTKEFFVEVTGTRKITVMNVINILACMFKDMGGKIMSVKIEYEKETTTTPDFNYESIDVKPEYVSEILGIDKMDKKTMNNFLVKMGYIIKQNKILIPPYRVDIIHPIDVVDDIGRAYTYDRLEPRMSPVFTIGNIFNQEIMIDRMREIMIGFEFLETFTLGLTSKIYQFDMTNYMPDSKVYVRISKAKATEVNMVRYWLLPELLRSLSINRERSYPIKLFEISDVVRRGSTDRNENIFVNHKMFSFIMSGESITFTDTKRILTKTMKLLGYHIEIKRMNHPTFIPGRCANVVVDDKEIGFIGEVHPNVLEKFGIQMPVSACEIDLSVLII